jgi:hypothetical protein
LECRCGVARGLARATEYPYKSNSKRMICIFQKLCRAAHDHAFH